MTNRRQQAAEWLATRLVSSSSDLVTFTRPGNDVLADLSATIGKSDHNDIGGDGMPILATSIDFIVEAADLVLSADGLTKPTKGDVVTWEGGTYEVRPYGESKACWRPSDSHGVLIRIHTKQLS